MEDKICLVTGVGPGTGTSMVRKFSDGGYKVIMISRSEERLQTLQKEIINTTWAANCDWIWNYNRV